MCYYNRIPGQQLGIPLDNETLGVMEYEEARFWMDFLMQAQQEIKDAENSGEQQPLVPSESLRRKRQRALTQYDGEKYCQMRQMAKIFIFPVF